jgi:hypothetical protein
MNSPDLFGAEFANWFRVGSGGGGVHVDHQGDFVQFLLGLVHKAIRLSSTGQLINPADSELLFRRAVGKTTTPDHHPPIRAYLVFGKNTQLLDSNCKRGMGLEAIERGIFKDAGVHFCVSNISKRSTRGANGTEPFLLALVVTRDPYFDFTLPLVEKAEGRVVALQSTDVVWEEMADWLLVFGKSITYLAQKSTSMIRGQEGDTPLTSMKEQRRLVESSMLIALEQTGTTGPHPPPQVVGNTDGEGTGDDTSAGVTPVQAPRQLLLPGPEDASEEQQPEEAWIDQLYEAEQEGTTADVQMHTAAPAALQQYAEPEDGAWPVHHPDEAWREKLDPGFQMSQGDDVQTTQQAEYTPGPLQDYEESEEGSSDDYSVASSALLQDQVVNFGGGGDDDMDGQMMAPGEEEYLLDFLGSFV